MGKCKKRTFYKTNSSYFMTRESAINNVFRMLKKTTCKQHEKNQFDYKKISDMISLFGLSAEELSEAGVSYENLRALESIMV